MRVRFAEFGGIPTRYYDAGSGPTVLLLHGVGVTAEIWWQNIEALAERHRVIAPDLVGSGLTGAGRYRDGPIHDHVLDHLEAMIAALDLGPIAVAGSSLGGLFAALLYFRRPERVTHLILASSGSVFNSDASYQDTWRNTLANGRSAFENPSRQACLDRLGRVVARMDRLPPEIVPAQMTAFAMPGALDLFLRRTEAMLAPQPPNHRVSDRLDRIAAPCLVVVGADDPRVSLADVEERLPRLPNASLRVVPHCGHYPPFEDEAFNASVLKFLSA